MKAKLLTLMALGMISFLSCSKYPPSSSRLTEDLAIYTKYDVGANFSSYATFALPPDVVYINGRDTTTLTKENAQALLSRIAVNMTNRGFRQVEPDKKPDMVSM